MIWIPFAAQLLFTTIEPAFVFPGESAIVRMVNRDVLSRSVLYSRQNLNVRPHTEGWRVEALAPAPARFTVLLTEGADNRPEDGTVVQIPVALSPRPTERSFLAFVATEKGRCDLVRTTVGDALLFRSGPTEIRTEPVLIADVAVRFAPQRPRAFVADYVYGLGGHLTLIGRPGGIAHVAIRVNGDRLHLRYLALYRQRGTLIVCGIPRPIELEAGEVEAIALPLSELKGSIRRAFR